MPYLWENPMKLDSLQPSVLVAKGKISFATLTHGCKSFFSLFAITTDGGEEANFMEFSHYIYENELTSKNLYFPMNFAKKSHFYFSFFKVDSQNPKCN